MDCDIVILYGSQTGNAEDLAKRLGCKAKRNGYSVRVQTMDSFPLKLLVNQKVVLFVCSTTGHGQAPENMKNFYSFIRRSDLPSKCLSSLNYAVFGLGDSSYTQFNWVSKVLYKRIKACGANSLIDLALGDEQHHLGCDATVYPKILELWRQLELTQISKSGSLSSIDSHVDSSYNVKLIDESTDHTILSKYEIFTQGFTDNNKIETAECLQNERMTSLDHFQDTRFLKFRRKLDKPEKFEPGDVCSIYPENSLAMVEEFATLLQLNLDQRITLKKRDPNFMIDYLYDHMPQQTTIRNLIRYYLDIQSVPKRSFFEYLWHFSNQDDIEKGKLKHFASTEGQDEMFEYCGLPKRSIIEVLHDFPNTVSNIKLEYLLDIIPPIKPRSFSIASSFSMYPDEIHLIVGVVKYKTLIKKVRKGLCSNYLSSRGYRDCIRYFIQKTDFKLPKNNETPIIMVGPGLGISPFRSFLQQRISIEDKNENFLYFGCRRKESDFYFEKELTQYENEQKLVLKVAFSRQQESKNYVQDLLKQDSLTIKQLIHERDAVLYVAGNSRLPEDLRGIIGNILGFASDDFEQSISMLEHQNRIQYDCW